MNNSNNMSFDFAEKELKDNVIFPDFCYHETEVPTNLGHDAPYFYLHGRLAKIVAFDCFSVSTPLLKRMLQANIILATTIIESVEYEVLMFCAYNEEYRRMRGYAVLIDDIEAIKNCLETYPTSYKPCAGDTPDEYLKVNHKEVWEILFHHANPNYKEDMEWINSFKSDIKKAIDNNGA